VRQMFEAGVLQSAFWHRFSMTAHSPVGLNPAAFQVRAVEATPGTFAHNDVWHEDPTGTDHELFSAGLAKSLYNYMHGVALDEPLQSWFDHGVPETSLPPDLIARYLTRPSGRDIKPSNQLVWIGGPVRYNMEARVIEVTTLQTTIDIPCPPATGRWLEALLGGMTPESSKSFTYASLQQAYLSAGFDDFTLFWFGPVMEKIKEAGLLVL